MTARKNRPRKVWLIAAALAALKPWSTIFRTAAGRSSVTLEEMARKTTQPMASARCGLRKGQSWTKAPRRRLGLESVAEGTLIIIAVGRKPNTWGLYPPIQQFEAVRLKRWPSRCPRWIPDFAQGVAATGRAAAEKAARPHSEAGHRRAGWPRRSRQTQPSRELADRLPGPSAPDERSPCDSGTCCRKPPPATPRREHANALASSACRSPRKPARPGPAKAADSRSTSPRSPHGR